MTTSRTISDHHWSDILRVLAPGPIALGMYSCVQPAAWLTTWQAVAVRRHAARRHAGDEGMARGTER